MVIMVWHMYCSGETTVSRKPGPQGSPERGEFRTDGCAELGRLRERQQEVQVEDEQHLIRRAGRENDSAVALRLSLEWCLSFIPGCSLCFANPNPLGGASKRSGSHFADCSGMVLSSFPRVSTMLCDFGRKKTKRLGSCRVPPG